MQKIQYFKQEKPWTCGPACMRMVLGFFGIKKSEAVLAKLLARVGEPGTPNRALVELAEKLKLDYVVQRNASLIDLKRVIADGFVVVVGYFDQIEHVGHFAVVKSLSKKKIVLLDPWYGAKCAFSNGDFVRTWRSGFDNDVRWFIGIRMPRLRA